MYICDYIRGGRKLPLAELHLIAALNLSSFIKFIKYDFCGGVSVNSYYYYYYHH